MAMAMATNANLSGGGIGSGGNPSGSTTSWKEHVLDEIPICDGDVGDAVTCVLHTILFTRAPGPVRPSEATCHAFPTLTYSLCAVGDVSRKVEHAVKRLEESLVARNSDWDTSDAHLHHQQQYQYTPHGHGSYGSPQRPLAGSDRRLQDSGGYYPPRGQRGHSHSQRQQSTPRSFAYQDYGGAADTSMAMTSSVHAPTTGCLVVAFFERKVKKALFGLMSNEEKVFFEKWIVPVRVAPAPPSPTQRELDNCETEAALQHALLHVLSAVQSIDHIPTAMYDFEISLYPSMEAMQREADGSYGLSGLALGASARLMGGG